MLVIAVFGVPLAIVCTATVFRAFNGKVDMKGAGHREAVGQGREANSRGRGDPTPLGEMLGRSSCRATAFVWGA